MAVKRVRAAMRSGTAVGAARVAGGGVVGIVSWPSGAHAATTRLATNANPPHREQTTRAFAGSVLMAGIAFPPRLYSARRPAGSASARCCAAAANRLGIWRQSPTDAEHGSNPNWAAGNPPEFHVPNPARMVSDLLVGLAVGHVGH